MKISDVQQRTLDITEKIKIMLQQILNENFSEEEIDTIGIYAVGGIMLNPEAVVICESSNLPPDELKHVYKYLKKQMKKHWERNPTLQ
jgi:hypothetical protein